MSLFYTYVWRREDGTPFYVGKGVGRRAWDTRQRSMDFKFEYNQGGCTVDIVDEFILESQAHAHEVELIEQYGRREYGGPLVNKTDGGEGASGRKLSPSSMARIVAANIGRKRKPGVGEKIRAALLGRAPPAHEIEKNAVAQRMAAPNSNNTSGFKGVIRKKGRKKWMAYIKPGGKQRSLGYYTTPENAALAYDKAAIEVWGYGKCYLNLPLAANDDTINAALAA